MNMVIEEVHRVTGVRYLHDYMLELTFKHGKVRIVDLKNRIGGNGVFKPLLDVNYFKQVKMNDAGNSIEWPNGADICPDVLWDISKPVKKAA